MARMAPDHTCKHSTGHGTAGNYKLLQHSQTCSMGGLVARFACGRLFDSNSGLICGLTPLHFIAMASPHTGITLTDGVAQMPLIQWLSGIKGLLQSTGPVVASSIFQQTGRQFLCLEQGVDGGASVVQQLVEDAPDRGLLCFSALAAFAQRTCYSCVSGDQWVTWANGSLRLPHQLPHLPHELLRSGQGVLHEEGPSCLSAPSACSAQPKGACTTASNSGCNAASNALPVLADGQGDAMPGTLEQDQRQDQADEPHVYMIKRLQTLPWRRVDVGFGGDPPFSGIPHNKIQARGWRVTRSSRLVVQHIVELLRQQLVHLHS